MDSPAPQLDTAAAVLAAVRESRSIADREEARILTLAVDWAAMHSVDSLDDAACDWFGNQPIPIAGEGAPLVAEFCVAEFALAIDRSTDAGRGQIAAAVELKYRLPRTWARISLSRAKMPFPCVLNPSNATAHDGPRQPT